jgi:arylsulfatase A-like enzyme
VADYYFEVERWDRLVGQAIAQLEEHDLLDNTIIIMTGDHGMPFPRGKGNLYDSGVRVPFAVRWGNGMKPGRTIDDFVSFADIAPTLLELTGTGVLPEMTGRSFAALLRSDQSGVIDAAARPDIVFGRERHVPAQEKPNMGGYPSRGLRNREFLYIRNYDPDLWPAGTGKQGQTNFPNQWFADCDGGPTKDYIIENRDKDESHRRAFQLCFAKRPAEELYDVRRDPGQLHNLAAKSEYQGTLATLRDRLNERLRQLNDPRASDPDYTGFDQHPYLGGGGGSRNKAK